MRNGVGFVIVFIGLILLAMFGAVLLDHLPASSSTANVSPPSEAVPQADSSASAPSAVPQPQFTLSAGDVLVDSVPQGADVYLFAKEGDALFPDTATPVGKTPYTAPYDKIPGRYVVVAFRLEELLSRMAGVPGLVKAAQRVRQSAAAVPRCIMIDQVIPDLAQTWLAKTFQFDGAQQIIHTPGEGQGVLTAGQPLVLRKLFDKVPGGGILLIGDSRELMMPDQMRVCVTFVPQNAPWAEFAPLQTRLYGYGNQNAALRIPNIVEANRSTEAAFALSRFGYYSFPKTVNGKTQHLRYTVMTPDGKLVEETVPW
jgi:hypothetical protein